VLASRPDLVHLDRIDLFLRSHSRPQDGQAAADAQLPAGLDRHPLDRADRLFGSPQHATADKGRKMLTDIAASIALERSAIFPAARRGAGAAPPR